MKVKYQQLRRIQSENLGKLSSLTSAHKYVTRAKESVFQKTIFTLSCCVGWGVNSMAWMWQPEGKWSELILFFHHTGSDGEIQITNLCRQLLYLLSHVAGPRQWRF